MVTQLCKPSPWESELGDSSGDRLTKKEKKKNHKDLKHFYR